MFELSPVLALQAGGSAGGGLLNLLPIFAIFVIFYFLLIRPQVRKQKEAEQEARDFRASLKNGDRVITSGGLYGVVTAVRDETVQLRIADAVKVEVLRTAVAGRQPEAGQTADSK
jgi:preprotein translocase subunit YajC